MEVIIVEKQIHIVKATEKAVTRSKLMTEAPV